MKLIHRFKAWALRRRLVRQRAENIRALRAGRRAAREIAARLARETRLANPAKRAGGEATRPAMAAELPGQPKTAPGQTGGRISGILSNIHLERRAV